MLKHPLRAKALCSGILSTPVAIAWRELELGVQGWGRVGEEAGVLCSVLSGQGLGGGQGWRDAQWETVLQLVANLITPESLFRPLVITPPPPPITTSRNSF